MEKKIALSENDDFKAKLKRSREILEEKLENNETIYGVKTAYGDSCNVDIHKELRHKLPLQLIRYHQCGMGKVFDDKMTRAKWKLQGRY
ncbi:MAG: aromatic amino acid lyase [Deltaproteobacteria bacterium]|nr:aromatic amino acid lyase [Deltaproteobacteria bacterium]